MIKGNFRGEAPKVGAVRECLLCSLWKPWGTFHEPTGATVCVDCRDASRLMPTLVKHRLMYGYAPPDHWSLRCECGWYHVEATKDASDLAAFHHMTDTLTLLNDFGVQHYG